MNDAKVTYYLRRDIDSRFALDLLNAGAWLIDEDGPRPIPIEIIYSDELPNEDENEGKDE